jgi:hypothetical protein
MPDESDSVSLRVTTGDLSRAIRLLQQNGHVLSPDTYQALVIERYRRRLQDPPREIRLARETFQALPRDVQLILTTAADP